MFSMSSGVERLGIEFCFFFFKQKTAYEMRISDWSSDVCSSDLGYLLKKCRAVRASVAAGTLIDAVPTAIVAPGTTAVWEHALDMIEAGQLTHEVFIQNQSAWLAQIITAYHSTAFLIKVPHSPPIQSVSSNKRQHHSNNMPFR